MSPMWNDEDSDKSCMSTDSSSIFVIRVTAYCYFNTALYVQSQAQCECVCMLLYQRIQIPIVWSCTAVFPYVQVSMLQLNRIKCTRTYLPHSMIEFWIPFAKTAHNNGSICTICKSFCVLGLGDNSILLFINFHQDIMMIWSYRVVLNPAVWIKDPKQIVIKTVVCLM